jgi:hypothetical protein
MRTLSKYSFGLGDRFGHQGEAQLKAIIEAGRKGIEITPVWNKSNREHIFTGTDPVDVRNEAASVTKNAGFIKPYYVDADHINLDTVGRFLGSSDFYTIDVADNIGRRASDRQINNFLEQTVEYQAKLEIAGIEKPFTISKTLLTEIAAKYLYAAQRAGEIYRKIENAIGKGSFITEISMDEVAQPQSPAELIFFLKMAADEKIPLQTIAPKFSGRFNKGIDFEGDPLRFAEEFETDLMLIDYGVKKFGLPENLKMSIHSGSDKFSIYPLIGKLIKKHAKGIHVKTAGTTWLEEVTGLALSGGEALGFVKEIYFKALEKIDELTSPYSGVIKINASSLPSQKEVSKWDTTEFADSIRHVPENRYYNPDMRQLMHVAYKLAALRKIDFFRLVEKNEKIISQCVFENIYNRHICRLFDIT